jgi:hypothetical protein
MLRSYLARGTFLVLICLQLQACSDHGTHTKLYAAMQMYGLAFVPIDQADALVDGIQNTVRHETMDAVTLSDGQAEEMAVTFARARMPTDLWVKAASIAVSMVGLSLEHFCPPI